MTQEGGIREECKNPCTFLQKPTTKEERSISVTYEELLEKTHFTTLVEQVFPQNKQLSHSKLSLFWKSFLGTSIE